MKKVLSSFVLTLLYLSNPVYAVTAERDQDPVSAVGVGIGTLLESAGSLAGTVFDLGDIHVRPLRLDAYNAAGGADDVLSGSHVDSGEWSRLGVNTTSEILSMEPSVNFTDDIGLGQGARVDLRGFGGEAKQALVLLDGIRFVEPFDNSAPWNMVAPQFLEEVRVMPGAGSPVYGEGALSGVIALRGRTPSKQWKSAFEQSIGSYNSTMTFMETGGTLPGGPGLWVAARYSETDGYRQNAGEDGTQAAVVSNGYLTDRIFIENRFFYSTKFTGIPGPLSRIEEEADRRQKDPDGQYGDGFSDELVQNGLRIDVEKDESLRLSNLFGYRLRNQNSEQSFGGAFPGKSLNDIGTESFSDVLQVTKSVSPTEDIRTELTAGSEWAIDDIHNPFTFLDLTFGPFSSDRSVDRRSVGAFLTGSIEYREKLTLEAGVRWDRLDWDIYDLRSPHLEKHKKAEEVSPSLSASYKVSESLAVYASYANAFKAPDVNTLIFETPNLFRPNPEVDASIARHAELGVKGRPIERLSVHAAIFHIDTRKEILFNDISNLNENFDTNRVGAETEVRAQILPQAALGGTFAHTQASFDGGAFDGRSIPLVPKNRWGAFVEWTPEEGSFARVQATGVMDRFALNDFNNIFPAEDYWTLDASIQKRVGPNGRLYARFLNILDERYSSFASSDGTSVLNVNPAPGFRFETGVRIEI